MGSLTISDSENVSLETPEWLKVLENRRKRPHKLAHEIGAGSPCLICKDKCKGLNLHFWRKMCIECKCRKEDHDFVDEEEYAQFEILFGAKRVKKITLKYNASNKTFDWIPQNASQELVIEYLNAIPESKLPITNTEGATYRKQQLEKQFPLHDVNPGSCHNLTAKEVNEFKKYLENLRNNVVGQGRIMKFQNSNLYQELSKCQPSTDSISTIDSESGNSGVSGHVRSLHDNGTGDAVTFGNEKAEMRSHPYTVKIDNINKNEVYSVPLTIQKLHSEKLKSKLMKPSKTSNENLTAKNDALDLLGKMKDLTMKPSIQTGLPPPPFGTKTSDNQKVDNNNSYPTNNMMSSFVKNEIPIIGGSNNYCRNQLSDNNRNNNMVDMNDIVQNRMEPGVCNSAFYSNNLNNDMKVESPVPSQGTYEKEKLNMNVMNASGQDLPFIPLQESQSILGKRATSGTVQPLMQDVPMHGASLIQKQDKKCVQCKDTLTPEDVVVTTERGGDFALWHARCFVCDMCRELLVDLMYFFHKGKVYCGRDYAKMVNIPRCFACDELIFVNEYTQAEDQTYHVRHFCCFHCDEPLAGKQYISKDNQPICLQCYQKHYGKNCSACLKLISVDEQRISFGDLHFHVDRQCFCCTKCLKSLLREKFVIKDKKIFCSKECVQR